MGIIGSEGFVSWFYAILYKNLRDICRKYIFIKYLIHIFGLILMISGIYLLIEYLISILSILAIFLILIGLFIFLTPLNL